MCWNCKASWRYKSHFVCFNCRIGWKKRFDSTAPRVSSPSSCRRCGMEGIRTSYNYRYPKQSQIKEWKTAEQNFRFNISGGPYIPLPKFIKQPVCKFVGWKELRRLI